MFDLDWSQASDHLYSLRRAFEALDPAQAIDNRPEAWACVHKALTEIVRASETGGDWAHVRKLAIGAIRDLKEIEP